MLKRLSTCFFVAFFAFFCCSSLWADTAKKVTNAKVLAVDTFFYSGSSKGVMITLDQKVPDYDLRKQIRITPSIGYFTIDRYYHETQGKYRVYGKFVGGKDYEIKVVGGLTNEGNFNIDAAYKRRKWEFSTGLNFVGTPSMTNWTPNVGIKYGNFNLKASEAITIVKQDNNADK